LLRRRLELDSVTTFTIVSFALTPTEDAAAFDSFVASPQDGISPSISLYMRTYRLSSPEIARPVPAPGHALLVMESAVDAAKSYVSTGVRETDPGAPSESASSPSKLLIITPTIVAPTARPHTMPRTSVNIAD